jgi:hypothetical protein
MLVFKVANFVYSKVKESLLKGQINVISNSIKLILIDKTYYTPNQNSDTYVSDIPALAIKRRSDSIQNVSCTLGVLDANDVSIPDHNGSAFDAIVGYIVGTSDADSSLFFFIDNSIGLPFSGSAGQSPVTIVWDDGPNKIIAL